MTETYKHFVLAFDCTGVVLRDIPAFDRMIEEATEIRYQAFAGQCDQIREWGVDHGYELDARQGLTLKHDHAVCFYRSTYKGERCFFMRWSAIEFVWLARNPVPSLIGRATNHQ